jgi:hypothetical protein
MTPHPENLLCVRAALAQRIGVGGEVDTYTHDDWNDVFDVNLRGVVRGGCVADRDAVEPHFNVRA